MNKKKKNDKNFIGKADLRRGLVGGKVKYKYWKEKKGKAPKEEIVRFSSKFNKLSKKRKAEILVLTLRWVEKQLSILCK